MKLPAPPPRYDTSYQARFNLELEQEDVRNHKRGADLDLGKTSLILLAPNGTRYKLAVSNTGTLSAVAIA